MRVHYRARGRGSGAEVEGHESALFTFRDGKVVRYEWFHGETDAFEALGRLEQPARLKEIFTESQCKLNTNTALLRVLLRYWEGFPSRRK